MTSEHSLTLYQQRTRFSHPMSSRPYQDADFIVSLVAICWRFDTRFDYALNCPFQNTFDAGWSRGAALSHYRQLYSLSNPPPSLSPNRQTRQGRSSQRTYEDNRESSHRPYTVPYTDPRAVGRFAQGRSNCSIASVQSRDCPNTPIHQPSTETLQDPSTSKLHGLARRPRVQISRKRASRVSGDGSRSVDLGVPQVTEMDYSVMSVPRPDADGSGPCLSSGFVPPPVAARPMSIGGPDSRAHRGGTSPSSHVNSETEWTGSRIKAREGAGSVSANTHSIPKKELHTTVVPSLMNDMEEQWPSSSPVSTPKAPPLDQQPVIREDLQRDERLIARCLTDPRISFREAAAVKDRKSFELVRSTYPPELSHLQDHAVPVKKDDDRKQPKQQALFQELHHMLEPQVHPGSDPLRSVEVCRDEKLGEGITRRGCVIEEELNLDTSRGPDGSKQTLHMDILLAQRVVRDAMQEDEGWLGQACMLSAMECGEEVADASPNWQECGVDRKHSTRSVFDWGYA